ncbi:hypothetical protein MACH17_24120 [Phaeobacter inhibens]|uniref:TRAP transporter substrate-binding protein DctP n=1 Tax=Phaeobacter inhibens TaxID=221822 RepID=UPI0027740F6C|nr:TRAP transporter substrate-binding protein DctP [Phaeobacter inhibens]GLO70895.1 hypothetical protein MACH17_24120 [Phaeobacter inhibens]
MRSLDDLQGLNIRVPSRNAGLVIEAWGANPVSMPAPEIYNSMQTGVIDGAFIDATTLRVFKLQEVTGSITTGMEGTISSFFMIMNRDSFDGLTEAQQQAVLDAGNAASLRAHAIQIGGAASALEAFGATEGKEIITLSPEEAVRFNDASSAVVNKVIADADAAGLDATEFVNPLGDG